MELLCELEPQARQFLLASLHTLTLDPGTLVFQPGQYCERYLHLCDGQVRVYLTDSDGNSITLYRIVPGGSCILTNAALLAREKYVAYAVTETKVRVQVLDAASFRKVLACSPAFQSKFFGDQGRKFLQLFETLGRVTFESIDARLHRLLDGFKNAENVVSRTHAELAVELGTAREVISRRLKYLEDSGHVRLGRGKIWVL